MDVLLVLVVLVAAVLLIAAPLRRARGGPEEMWGAARAELEAEKESKYREIRDAELDYRTGKLAKADWQRLDASLRADALDLLHRLDELEERSGTAG
jgi:hypothetical protein